MKKLILLLGFFAITTTIFCTETEEKAVDQTETIEVNQEDSMELAAIIEQVLNNLEFDEDGNAVFTITFEASIDECIENPELIGQEATNVLIETREQVKQFEQEA